MPGSYHLPYLTTLSLPWHLESYPPSILEILRVETSTINILGEISGNSFYMYKFLLKGVSE